VLGDAGEAEGAEDPERPSVVNADVDVRTFRPETLVFLEEMGAVWGAPTASAALDAIQSFAERPDATALVDAARADVIDARNRHLLARIDASLADHRRVVVPWGALHLAELEAGLVARGFVAAGEIDRPLVRYATVVAALRSFGARAAGP
jgi:hypothetical protein